MNKSKIEWCKYTWNPVTGCCQGCPYCYAAKIAHRFTGKDAECGNCRISQDCPGKTTEGKCPDFREYRQGEKTHVLDSKQYGFYPKKHYIAFPYGFEPTLHRYRLQEPGQVKTPSTVFVCSMADLFGDFIPDEWIFEVFRVCTEHPQHRYMFLTKNPYRYRELLIAGKLPESKNMWYGTTVTKDKSDYFHSWKYNSFLSIEPIQGRLSTFYHHAKWVIIGQETGNRKERITAMPEWVNEICGVCHGNGIPVFMKNNLSGVVENLVQEDAEYKTGGCHNGQGYCKGH